MHASFIFVRIFFLVLCVLFSAMFALSQKTEDQGYLQAIIGALGGLVFGYAVINVVQFFKRFNLRSFNTVILGLFFGYLMGQVLLSIIEAAAIPIQMHLPPETLAFLRIGLFLVTSYVGVVMTSAASEEFYFSIPFISLKPNGEQKKDLIIDQSILSDSRLVDLAACGLLDSQLILPRFLTKELAEKSESADEVERGKARRCLEMIKKLEGMSHLELRYSETDFPELIDLSQKNIELAKLLHAAILLSDPNRVSQIKIEGVRIVNIYVLSNAFKPLAHLGEHINIKIQRFGKDPRQGVGYLEDGTMVVVNGGAEFIGDSVRAQVLSVKQTSSGRIIFCNVNDTQICADGNILGSMPNLANNKEIDNLIKNYSSQ